MGANLGSPEREEQARAKRQERQAQLRIIELEEARTDLQA